MTKRDWEVALSVLNNLEISDNTPRNLIGIAFAKEAVEKQIPKKPYTDNENGIYVKDYCPTCNRVLFPDEHHCKCGQALDWSEIND